MGRSRNESRPQNKLFPRWGFAVLASGGFWASGLYAGMIRSGATSIHEFVAAIGFGLLGLVMLWGVLGRQQ